VKTAVISFCIDLGLIETNAQRLQMALNLEIVEIERYEIYKWRKQTTMFEGKA